MLKQEITQEIESLEYCAGRSGTYQGAMTRVFDLGTQVSKNGNSRRLMVLEFDFAGAKTYQYLAIGGNHPDNVLLKPFKDKDPRKAIIEYANKGVTGDFGIGNSGFTELLKIQVDDIDNPNDVAFLRLADVLADDVDVPDFIVAKALQAQEIQES